MATINAYFYSTLSAANAKIAEINQGEGIPNNGYLTQTYCEAKSCVGGYYIEFDSVTSKYCNNLTSVTINEITL